MSGNHEELIEDIAHSAEVGQAQAREMIRAANECGFDLAKLPERLPVYTGTNRFVTGYNHCLDSVEIVRIYENPTADGCEGEKE